MERIALFDLDGTLLDSAPDIHSALDRMMARLGRTGFSRPEVWAMIGDGVQVLVQRACAARGARSAHAARGSPPTEAAKASDAASAPSRSVSAPQAVRPRARSGVATVTSTDAVPRRPRPPTCAPMAAD